MGDTLFMAKNFNLDFHEAEASSQIILIAPCQLM